MTSHAAEAHGDSFTEPAPGGTIDHILTLLPSLVPSAQRVARVCVERPGDVVNMSGSDLAEAANTSAASVSRTCQALGFRSFLHMRLLLGRDLGATGESNSPKEDGTSGLLREFADGASSLLKNALVTVDVSAFDTAARSIIAAPRVLIVGTGGSQPVAQSTALSFTAIGRACEAPADAVAQQLAASSLHPNDVCVVISSSGTNSITLASAQAAARAGATVIGVSNFTRSALSEVVSVMLVSGARFQTWDRGLLGATLAQLLLLGALQAAVERDSGETAERARAVVRSEILGSVVDDTRPRPGTAAHRSS